MRAQIRAQSGASGTQKVQPPALIRSPAKMGRECAHFNYARSGLAAMPLGGGSCSRRTNHPLVASGSEERSHKIELVFSASLETVVGASAV
jgi:hypothetical protein